MKLVLKTEWKALDATAPGRPKTIAIPAGTHEIERIPNPCHKETGFWLVLKGTMIGGAEGFWRQCINDGSLVTNPKNPNFGKPIDWKEFEVVIEDDEPVPVTVPASVVS